MYSIFERIILWDRLEISLTRKNDPQRKNIFTEEEADGKFH